MRDVSGEAPADVRAAAERRGQEIIANLEKGALPQMVDWFDPGLLAKVGVRSVISATLGSYTDQRLIQAATDNATEEELRARYDYSGAVPGNDVVAPYADGAVWVDYLADLGDGFESTYAMAYLLAADELKVRGEVGPVPAAQLLVMGGDQVYPDATKQEYSARLRDPYDWAYSTKTPKRKLFAIPGNHDWYDGLSAFSALFCSSRDRISGGIGTQLGGWRCHQHRSYFAIKLPHDWWIWGPDIQLADNLDDSQRDYFDLMADQTKPGDKIILLLAEPSWLHENYENMHEISMLARKHQAKICAVIAGDWHHYSRYRNKDLGIEFITCGGGGAFAHSTHGLKSEISLKWATPTGEARTPSPADSREFNRSEELVIGPGGTDFTKNPEGSQQGKTEKASAPAPDPKPSTDIEGIAIRREKPQRKVNLDGKDYDCQAEAIYPARWKSRLISFRNLWLPFHNRRFAVLVGIVYFVYAWAWAAADPRQSPIMKKFSSDLEFVSETTKVRMTQAKDRLAVLKNRQQELARVEAAGAGTATPGAPLQPPSASAASLAEDVALAQDALTAVQNEVASIEMRKIKLMGERDAVIGSDMLQKIANLFNDEKTGLGSKIVGTVQAMFSAALTHLLDPQAFFIAAEQSPMFAFLLLGLWAGLISYVELPSGFLGTLGKLVVGTIHFAAHIVVLLLVAWVATGLGGFCAAVFTGGSTTVAIAGVKETVHVPSVWTDLVRVGLTLLITLPLGGILGGLVMGLYWTVTCALFSMHTGDAFGALGIRHYKHFLRIKLEPDRATIYPIAVDTVPGRKGWRSNLHKDEAWPSHHPLIMPKKPLAPRLIEPPIRIDVAQVSQ